MSDDANPTALVERRGNVVLITINRPESRNAVNAAVSTAVGDGLQAAQDDPGVRAVVITGAGDVFCAGVDLKAVARGEGVYHPHHEEWGFAGFVQHFIDKPIIAAVNGTALGGGTELALASDLVVAEQRTTFGLPEAKRGIIAGGGGIFRLVDQLPRKVANQMLLTGEPMDAAAAVTWGLINQVVPDGTVVEAALALAYRIASNAPLAVRASKRVAYGIDPADTTPKSERYAWSRTRREAEEIVNTQDCAEGLSAFIEKRPPVWVAR